MLDFLQRLKDAIARGFTGFVSHLEPRRSLLPSRINRRLRSGQVPDEEVMAAIRAVPPHYADNASYFVDMKLPFLVADQGNVSLTTTQKTLWATGASSPTILPQANYWNVGKTLRLTAALKWTAVANTNQLTFGMCYGNADAPACNVVTAAFTPVSSTSTFTVIAQGYATCRTTGTGGTLSMWGLGQFPSGLSTTGYQTYPSAGVTVVSTIDTTVATNALSFQALRATAGADTVAAVGIALEAMN